MGCSLQICCRIFQTFWPVQPWIVPLRRGSSPDRVRTCRRLRIDAGSKAEREIGAGRLVDAFRETLASAPTPGWRRRHRRPGCARWRRRAPHHSDRSRATGRHAFIAVSKPLTAAGVHQSSWLAKWPWNGDLDLGRIGELLRRNAVEADTPAARSGMCTSGGDRSARRPCRSP